MRTAWSKISDAPAMTFSSVFCAASATAMPPTPSPASAGVGSTEKWRSSASRPPKMTSRSTPRRATRSSDTDALLAGFSRRTSSVSTSPLTITSSQATDMMLSTVAALDQNCRSRSESGSTDRSQCVPIASSSRRAGAGIGSRLKGSGLRSTRVHDSRTSGFSRRFSRPVMT